MSRRLLVLTALFVLLVGLAPAGANADMTEEGSGVVETSLPSVDTGDRPGPDVLYDDPPAAPVLDNHDPRFRAPMLRVSGAEAYLDGEYLYSDFLYDDTGDGSADYPDGPYADNGADLVEFRVAVDEDEIAYRLTFNTLLETDAAIAVVALDLDDDPSTGADQLPGDPGSPFPGTDEAITLWGTGATHTDFDTDGHIAETVDLAVQGDVDVHLDANQLTVTVPRDVSTPSGTVRTTVAAGVHDRDEPGTWLPYDGDRAIYNLAFRFDEPISSSSSPPDAAQNDALSNDEPTRFAHDIDFGTLDEAGTDLSGVPEHGTMVRFFPSRLELGEGRASSGFPALLGQLQPYSLYVPGSYSEAAPSGFTLNLHSLGESYWQYNGSTGVQQLGEQRDHLVATPHARGTDGWYQHEAEYDVFEVWNDVARHYALDPDRTASAGYSMGGYGTYRLGTRYPDLFGAAFTTVGPPGDGIWVPPLPPTGGAETLSNLWLENARNVPYLNVVAAPDELVPYAGTMAQNTGAGALGHGLLADVRRESTAQGDELAAVTDPLGEATATLHELDDAAGFQSFEELGYRYHFRTYPTAEHLTLAVLGYDVPGSAEFLGDAEVDRDPAHVTFAAMPGADATVDVTGTGDEGRLVADGAYWVADIELAEPDADDIAKGAVDAFSHGHGQGRPRPERHTDAGVGPVALAWQEVGLDWTEPEAAEPANLLEVELANVGGATVDLARAALDPGDELTLEVSSDAEAALRLDGEFPANTEVLRDGEPINAEVGEDAVTLPIIPGAHTYLLLPGEQDDPTPPDEQTPGEVGRDRADEQAGKAGEQGRDRADDAAEDGAAATVGAASVDGRLASAPAGSDARAGTLWALLGVGLVAGAATSARRRTLG